jgi:hypothetical protein
LFSFWGDVFGDVKMQQEIAGAIVELTKRAFELMG